MRYTARGRLPNSDLGALLAAIAEFIAHHRKVDQHMFDLDEDERAPPQEAFTQRLQEVMTRLRAYA